MKPGRRQRIPRIEPGSEGRMDYVEGGYSGGMGGGTVPGAGAMGRIHALRTTPTLGPGEDALFELDFAESCQLVEVSASLDCWIRVYNTAAARMADATRLISKDPTPGEGIIGEVYPYAPDHLTIAWSPVPYFNNDDAPLTKKAYFAVKNMSLTTGPIDLDFTILPQEYVNPGGPQGDTGLSGRTLFILTAAPGAGLGQDGDSAFDKTAKLFYGPKSGGVWPSGVSLVGSPGTNGKNVLYGTADPTASDGVDGEFWINITTHYIFGPKVAGAWPSGTSLVGPPGSGSGIVGVGYAQTSAYSAVTAQIPVDDTIPQNTEGSELLTVAYTPKSATSKLIIEACLKGSMSSTQNASVAIFQDAGADAIGAGSEAWVTSNYMYSVSACVVVASGSTTARTFKMRVGPAGAVSLYVNGASAARRFGGVNYSYLRVTEIGD